MSEAADSSGYAVKGANGREFLEHLDRRFEYLSKHNAWLHFSLLCCPS
jgi:hypothetical protein